MSTTYLFAMRCGSRTCKPNSVCRKTGRTVIPLGRALLRGSSDLPGGMTCRASTCPGRSRGSLPIWSCSVWGLPCPPHYCGGGALLPHLFTLTPTLQPRRYVFCGTFRRPGLIPASRTLSGTLLCGVRTFLSRRPKTSKATVRSSCQPDHYIRWAQSAHLTPKGLARFHLHRRPR